VLGGYPDVTWDKMLVYAMTVRTTLHLQSLDTIVATNLHADILSDLAGALAGSPGVAPTANIDPERRFPSIFEPIHDSAFDITGKGIANPVASFWTAARILDHLGEADASARLMRAVERVTGAGIVMPSWGQSRVPMSDDREQLFGPERIRSQRFANTSSVYKMELPNG
jgi:tartrate dehydrogenase/decarboxylase / D-malate dehydrogenase